MRADEPRPRNSTLTTIPAAVRNTLCTSIASKARCKDCSSCAFQRRDARLEFLNSMKGKISHVQTELAAIDKEILALHNELDAPVEKEKEASVISKSGRLSAKDESKYRLFKLSIAKKPVFKNEDSFSDDIIQKRPPIRIKGYVPPQGRVHEGIMVKQRKISALKGQEEEKFREECPFEPVREAQHSIADYSPGHLMRPKKVPCQVEMKEPGRLRPVGNENGIYERQQMKSKVKAPENQPSKKITKQEKEDLLERLACVRKTMAKPSDDGKQGKKTVARKATIERLVAQSVPKSTVSDEEPGPVWHMDKQSKRIVQGVTTNVYQESLESKARREAKMREIQEWQEAVEQHVADGQQRVKYRRIAVPEHCEVAGTEEHLERMAKSHKRKESPVVKERQTTAVRPFRCYHRQFKVKQQQLAAEQVLADIEALLG